MLSLIPKALRKAQLVAMRKSFAYAVRHQQVTLLGDSITHGLGQAKYLTNMGKHGLTSHELRDAMPWLKGIIHHSHVVSLMIGTNDAWQGMLGGIEQRFEVILAGIPEHIPVVWSSIPPTIHYAFDLRRQDQVNRYIEVRAKERPNTSFVDTWDLFAHPHGRLDLRHFIPEDRVHFSPTGYRRWASALQLAINQHKPSSEGFSFGQTK